MALEREFCKWSFCSKPEVETIETDLLLVGGGMACCGAAVDRCWRRTAASANRDDLFPTRPPDRLPVDPVEDVGGPHRLER